MSEDVAYILRIAGVGDSSGQYLWTTRPLPYSVSATVYTGGLSSVPDVLRHEVGVLDAVGSDAGISASVIYSLGGSVLLDSRVTVAQDVDGATLRVLGATHVETSIQSETEPDLAESDFVWIRGECLKVAALPVEASGVWSTAVARGQLGTVAQAIAETTPGAIVCTRWPGIVGARVTLSRVAMSATSTNDEVVVYRGVIGSVSSRGPVVEMQIGSALAALRDTAYATPAAALSGAGSVEVSAVPGDGSASVTLAVPDGAISIPYESYGWIGTSAVTHAWLALEEVETGSRKALVLVAASVPNDAIRIGAVEQCYLDGRRVARNEAFSALLNGRWQIVDSRLADTIAATSPSELVVELLTGKARPGARGGLTADQINVASLQTITRVARVRELGSGEMYSGAALFVMPYQDRPIKLRDLLEQMLLPLGVSIAPGRDGRIRAIDWGQSTYQATTVQPSDLRGHLTGWALSDEHALREVTLRATRDGQELSSRIVSDLAANVTTGGRVLEIEAGLWGLTETRWRAVQDRWSVLLSLWQRSAPEMRVDVARSLALDVGDVVRLPIPSLVSWDGQRYEVGSGAEVYAVVTGVSPRLRAPVDEVHLVAYGWGVLRADGFWGAAARVTGTAGGAIQVGDDYTAIDDAAAFVVGQRIILVDEDGRRLCTNDPCAVVTAIATNEITAPDLDARPSVGDRIITAPFDDQPLSSGVIVGGTYWADDTHTQADATKGHYTYS